jgi:hypothetical protein
MNIILHPEASIEFSEATRWYEEQQVGLGKKFAIEAAKLGHSSVFSQLTLCHI